MSTAETILEIPTHVEVAEHDACEQQHLTKAPVAGNPISVKDILAKQNGQFPMDAAVIEGILGVRRITNCRHMSFEEETGRLQRDN
jgi:hypothetical protein